MKITQGRLKEVLTYDPATGLFHWKSARGPRRTDRPAGTIRKSGKSSGYVTICIDRVQHQAHRLAILYVTGNEPGQFIDHKNGDRSDNRFTNLRPCTRRENAKNKKRQLNNLSGFKGVSTSTKGRTWYSEITNDGSRKYLGSFPTKEQAAAAYDAAARSLHGDFARPNGVA